MVRKILQVGIIGPNDLLCSKELYDFGFGLGKKIAAPDRIFISGGKGGFMEAVFKGVKVSGNSFTGQTVGILPEEDKHQSNNYCDIIIPSGLGIARNILIINSSDIIIAAGGGAGTLSELAFAWQKGKEVLCFSGFAGWTQKLAGVNIDERFKDLLKEVHSVEQIEKYLEKTEQER